MDARYVGLRRLSGVFRGPASRIVVTGMALVLAGLLAAAGLAGLAALLGNSRVTVRGRSMAPLLEDGELVLIDRLAYRFGRPRRGDVALVRGRADGGPNLLLKWIVGLPDEAVMLSRDRLHIDGHPLDLGRPVVGSSPGRWRLDADSYFLLSENLAVGTDSRHTGPVHRADLLGRAWLVYAPAVRRLSPARTWPS